MPDKIYQKPKEDFIKRTCIWLADFPITYKHFVIKKNYKNQYYYKNLDDDWSGYKGQDVVIVEMNVDLNQKLDNNVFITLLKLSDNNIFPALLRNENHNIIIYPQYSILVVITNCSIKDFCKNNKKLKDILKSRFFFIGITDNKLKNFN